MDKSVYGKNELQSCSNKLKFSNVETRLNHPGTF